MTTSDAPAPDANAEGRTPHPVEPAEGAESPGSDAATVHEGRGAHSEDPAEGADDPAVTGE